MKFCPKCGGHSRVYDVRTRKQGEVARMRKCLKCGERWGTIEVNSDRIRAAERSLRLSSEIAALAARIGSISGGAE